jgi:hypothetical protein
MSKTYEIGDTIVLLDEIVAIGDINRAGSNYVYVPIHLKGGIKISARISAKGDNEKAYSLVSPFAGDFMERFEAEYDDFRKAWQSYIFIKNNNNE